MRSTGSCLYSQLQKKGLTHSKRHFSRVWLRRADNYLCLRGERGPSLDAQGDLFRALLRAGRLILAARVACAMLFGGTGYRV